MRAHYYVVVTDAGRAKHTYRTIASSEGQAVDIAVRTMEADYDGMTALKVEVTRKTPREKGAS